jgi:hypothetical protein
MADTTTILDPEGVPRAIPNDQVQAALSAGGKQASKVIAPEGTVHWIPNESLEDARKAGGTVVNSDGTFHVTPMAGESFADTMKRAASAGKTVTPEQITSQTKQGAKDLPLVLGSAAGIGIAGPAVLAAPGEVAAAAPGVAEALQEAAKAHPFVSKIIEEGLKRVVGPGVGIAGAAKLLKLLQ